MIAIDVDLTIYPLEVVRRAAHAFSGRCFVAFERRDGRLRVQLTPQNEGDEPRDLAGSFANALLDHSLRVVIAEETRAIRELIVAQAFAEADLLDRRESESDYEADPRGIGATR